MMRWRFACFGRLLLVSALAGLSGIAAADPVWGQDDELQHCPARPPDSPLQLGLHMDLTWEGDADQRRAAIQRARTVHATVSRNSLLWHFIEPAPGRYDWELTDAIVDELTASGIEPLFVIVGSPTWANGASSNEVESHLFVPRGAEEFRQWLDRYRNFVRMAVLRYQGKVTKWELWSEQNEPFTWKPWPNVHAYADWFRTIQGEIKKIDPNAEVALGGLAGLSASIARATGTDFLEDLYQQQVYPDIVTIHPYSDDSPATKQRWSNSFRDIETIRKLMVRHGQGGKPMWVTEWGWSTADIDEPTQARWVGHSLRMLYCDYPYVSLATYFVDHDRVPLFYHGLYHGDGRAKPSAGRFAAIASDVSRLNSR